jgi:cation transport ATPase
MISPYDESWLLDNLAVEMQLNHPLTTSIVSASDDACGGCGAKLNHESVDDRGRQVKAFLCGHKYIIGRRTVSIERV